MRQTSVNRRKGRQGSVIIESALIFVVFAGMLIGAMDFAQFLFIHQALVERARYAARWGAIQDATDATSIRNMVLYYQAATPAAGTQTYFGLTAQNITVTNPGVNTDNYRLNIKISGYSYTVLSPFIAGIYTGIPVTVSVPLGLYN